MEKRLVTKCLHIVTNWINTYMATEKTVKILLLAAIVAVVLSVVGYVVVFAHDYIGCQQLEDAAVKAGKPMSCSEIKAAAKAADQIAK